MRRKQRAVPIARNKTGERRPLSASEKGGKGEISAARVRKGNQLSSRRGGKE